MANYSLKIVSLLVVLSLSAFAAQAGDSDMRLISVKGEATAQSAPNKADLSINLFGSGKTAAKAKEESDDKLRSLYKVIKKYGIDTAAVNTNQSSVQPQYDYKDGKRIFRDYQSQHRVTIEIDKLDAVAEISDELVKAGVDRIESLQYGMKDDAALKQQALVKALIQAKSKAKALAKVAGVELGKVVSISEGGSSYHPPMPLQRNMMMKSMAMDQAESVAPPAGEVEVRQTINAVFELN